MIPERARDGADFAAVLALIRAEFAFMDGRIDPPSSMHELTNAAVARQAAAGEIWMIRADGRPIACAFLSPLPDALYLGKLAVSAPWRGRGLARRLVTHAEMRARALRHPVVRIKVRVELAENQAAFRRMGFWETGRMAHPGFDRPTSVVMEKPAGDPAA